MINDNNIETCLEVIHGLDGSFMDSSIHDFGNCLNPVFGESSIFPQTNATKNERHIRFDRTTLTDLAKNSVDLYKRIAFLSLSIRLKVRLKKLKNKMNIKSGLLFLTIFEINVNAFAKRRNDLEYLKTNAHQLHVSRISFILFAMSHRLCLIVNGFFKLNSVISKRHGPLPSSQFTGRLSCKHVGDR